jgi:uncharacterized protein
MNLVPHIGFGQVWHARLRPKQHSFVYPTFFLMLPMRALRGRPVLAGALAWNTFGALAFRDQDHGDGRGPQQGGALAWLETVLHNEGIVDADGEVWLQCYPRVLGYSFKPVSFWYCHRADGSLRAIVAEVNNTFGEQHAYLLEAPVYGQEIRSQKRFHVSPFCPIVGEYRFAFQREDKCGSERGSERIHVRIDYHDSDGPLVLTGISGELEPITQASRRRAIWTYPFLSLTVIARIHWQALLLWIKRAPYHPKPSPPNEPVSRTPMPGHEL